MKSVINTDTMLGAASVVAALALLQSSYAQSAAVFVLPGDAPPFLVPQLMLYATLLVGALMVVQGLRNGGVEVGTKNWGKIALAVMIVVAATALMQPVGYLVVAPLAVFASIRVLGYRNHLVNGLVSIGVVGLLYLLLVNFAQMPLPKIPGLGV
jgi:phosphatidylglycerophosphate synthase